MSQKSIASEVREVVRLLPPQLVSSTVFIWTYPFSIFLAVATTPVNIPGGKELALWMLIGFLAHSAMYPFVYYGKSVKKLSDQFLLVILMGIARGSVVGLVAPLMGLQDSLPVPQRVYNSTLAVFYWMQAGAIILQYGSLFKETVKKLLTEVLEKGIVNLPEVAKSSTSELVTIIGHLQEKIVKTVGSKPSRAEIERASSEIDSLIDTHIRPLSQSGWKDGNLVWIRAGFLAVLRRTLTSQKIPIIPVIVLTSPFSLVVQITRIGFWATVIVQSTWITLVIVLDRIILPKISTERGYAKVNLLFLGSLIILMYPVTFIVQSIIPFATPASQSAMVLGYLISAVSQSAFFIIGAMLFSIQKDQGFAFQFLSDIIKKGELEELLKQTQSGNLDTKFAQYVHAEVQSQLLACKLLLLKAAESDFELFPPEITKQIIDRMEKIQVPYMRPVARITSDRVNELSQSWLGLADISYSLSPELHQLQSYSDVTSQLIEEAIVNSIRHGNATKIRIESRVLGDLLEVVITDNGKLARDKSKGGLGTILFNTFAKEWNVSDISGQTVMTFTIATQSHGVSR
jgi:hypothetical protein